jgi:hypothetical protein
MVRYFLPPCRYPSARGTNHHGGRESVSRSPVVSYLNWRSDLDNVPLKTRFKEPDRACLGKFAPNFVW